MSRAEGLARQKEKLKEYGFTYVSGYVNHFSKLTIKCDKCGTVRTVNIDYLNRRDPKRNYGLQCRGCLKIAREERELRFKLIRHIRYGIMLVANKKKKEEREHREPVLFECQCQQCGETFKTARKRKYCSEECAKKFSNTTSWRVREMKLQNALVDRDISLNRLYERDNGICYICGKQCDWNDYEMRGETFIAGNNYPSVEHIKPLSKGGKHEWKNVKLAHRLCNTVKGAREIPLVAQ